MKKLTRADLLSLEDYAVQREAFRQKVIAHKKHRRVALGANAALYFEDALTVQYQVQEMLRIEKIFEPAGIEEELAVYNPMIPDGSNWKATFMLEYADVGERKAALAQLVGIEHCVWMQVEGFERITPIANEDLDRSHPEKTAAVHFLRFELNNKMCQAILQGHALSAGIEHPNYRVQSKLSAPVRHALANDIRV